LEGANKQYGTQILMGVETKRRVGDAFVTREIDNIAVYGRAEGLAVYELVGLTDDLGGERAAWIAYYEAGLSRYRGRDFAGAILDFEAALREKPGDRPAQLLLDRCRRFLQSGVNEDWQPVAALSTK
jgi:adenylate cyclase